MNIHHHAHAAGIMLILTLVESFSFASFHIILNKTILIYKIGRKIISNCKKNKYFTVLLIYILSKNNNL